MKQRVIGNVYHTISNNVFVVIDRGYKSDRATNCVNILHLYVGKQIHLSIIKRAVQFTIKTADSHLKNVFSLTLICGCSNSKQPVINDNGLLLAVG
jgi:hypothetical protein